MFAVRVTTTLVKNTPLVPEALHPVGGRQNRGRDSETSTDGALRIWISFVSVQHGRDIPSRRPRGTSGRHVSVTLTTGSASVTSRTARKPMTDREWWFVVVITGALTSSAADKESSDRRLRQALITFNWRHWVESKKTNIKKTSTKILRKNKDFEKESIQTRVFN